MRKGDRQQVSVESKEELQFQCENSEANASIIQEYLKTMQFNSIIDLVKVLVTGSTRLPNTNASLRTLYTPTHTHRQRQRGDMPNERTIFIYKREENILWVTKCNFHMHPQKGSLSEYICLIVEPFVLCFKAVIQYPRYSKLYIYNIIFAEQKKNILTIRTYMNCQSHRELSLTLDPFIIH